MTLNEVQHWHQRAEEARVLADQMSTTDARETMLRVAQGYETMERNAAERIISTEKKT